MQFIAGQFVLGSALGINVLDIVFSLTAFLILMALLRKYAFGPLLNVMKEREEHIANEIEVAEKNRKDAEKLLTEQREELKKTRAEAHELIENARKLGEKQQQDIIEAARQEAERIKESAAKEIAQERDMAIRALREQTASLAVMIASKVVEKELNELDQEQLIKEYIQEIGEER